jgi:hypothetical protein
MGDLDDYDFSTGDAGASNVYNMEAGQIRVGGCVILYHNLQTSTMLISEK